MSRLSLHDKRGDAVERKLPICRMCCQLFSTDSIKAGDAKSDKRIASFRPCGHVFHYACIMSRYQRMEDNCSCVTCFARYVVLLYVCVGFCRMDDLPMILFMEWSKTARPVSHEASQEIEIVSAASDSASLEMRDQVNVLKHRLDSLQDRKDEIIKSINQVTDALETAKSRCQGLEEICEAFSDRLARSTEIYTTELRNCQELESRIKRDHNSAVVGELSTRLADADYALVEFINARLSESADPDDLLIKIASFYESYKKRVKDASKQLDQLRTSVHSLKREIQIGESQVIANTNKRKIVATQPKPVPARIVIDRKTAPIKHNHQQYMQDDLLHRKPSRSNFSSLFN